MTLLQAAAGAGDLPGGYLVAVLQALLALAAVSVLAWVVLRWAGRSGALLGGGRRIRVLERVPLEPRRSLYLVAVGDRVLLLGAGDAGPPAVLAELDPGELPALEEGGPRPAWHAWGSALLASGRRGAGTAASGLDGPQRPFGGGGARRGQEPGAEDHQPHPEEIGQEQVDDLHPHRGEEGEVQEARGHLRQDEEHHAGRRPSDGARGASSAPDREHQRRLPDHDRENRVDDP